MFEDLENLEVQEERAACSAAAIVPAAFGEALAG